MVNMTIVFALPSVAASVAVYELLSGRRPLSSTETLCRNCGYILRGISEPRCPECGVRR